MEWLETAVKMSIVAGFIGSVISFLVSYVVLRPLEATLSRLQVTVDKLGEQLTRTEERWHELDKHISEVDQRARSAHHRLDEHIQYHRRERDELEH